MYRPAKPAPTTTASNSATLLLSFRPLSIALLPNPHSLYRAGSVNVRDWIVRQETFSNLDTRPTHELFLVLHLDPGVLGTLVSTFRPDVPPASCRIFGPVPN